MCCEVCGSPDVMRDGKYTMNICFSCYERNAKYMGYSENDYNDEEYEIDENQHYSICNSTIHKEVSICEEYYYNSSYTEKKLNQSV